MNIFITGISSGIGRALAVQLLRDGHTVWGIARRGGMLRALQNEFPGRLVSLRADTSIPTDIQRVAARMKRERFIPDVVVLNAAISNSDAVMQFDFSGFKNIMETNVNGALAWVAVFLPFFQKRGYGTFVAISSTAAKHPAPHRVGYSASKAALSSAFRGLRVTFGQPRIRFHTIHFGPIDTSMWKWPKLFVVPQADKAARFILQTLERPSGSFYYPRLSTFIARLFGLVPDRVIQVFGRAVQRTKK